MSPVNDTEPRAATQAIAGRGGVSPIGTVSPNTGATAATNSSYGIGAYTSGINPQAGTSYIVQDTDYQGIVEFNTSSAVTVTLNSAVRQNFSAQILNIGSGPLTLTPSSTPEPYPINGVSSLTLQSNIAAIVSFANRKWQCFASVQSIPSPGTLTFPYKAVTSTYAIAAADYQIDCTSGTFVVTLPVAGNTGKIYSVKNSGTGTITLATTSSQLIDGQLTQILTQWDNLQVMDASTRWIIQ